MQEDLKYRLTQHLIVISFDAMSTEDFKQASDLPHFREFLQNAAYCKNVRSVYPSLTYPAHTSIVTGRWPKDHGIVNNTLLQPKRRSPDWYWKRRYVQGETIYDRAIQEKMKVAALLWPVTAKSKIQYNLPEIFANRPWQNQITVSLLNGTPWYQLELNRRFGYLRQGLNQPALDNFVHQSLLYTLKKYRPDLTLVHFSDLDAQKHHFGVASKESAAAIIRFDQRLGEVIETLRREGLYEKSTVVLLGDHGAIDEDKVIYLNGLLAQKGYITLKDNKICDWNVIAKHCDGSSYIYLESKADARLKEDVGRLLKGLAEEDQNGIESVYSASEAAEMGADPECAFMLEAQSGYYFSDAVEPDLIKTLQDGETGGNGEFTAATHGYSPLKPGYTTVFAAAGRGIKPNLEIGRMSLLDEGPTMARLLGLRLNESEGRILEEIIYEKD